MPKISEEQWQQRRLQILEAAWRCFYRNGVQSTTMEDIIAESQMSASAMYRYFRGKEDIILSAIAASLGALAQQTAPLLGGEDVPVPADLIARFLLTVERFSERDGYNLLPIAIHGWSEAQRDERVRALLRDFYLQFRARIAECVVRWQKDGIVGAQASALEVAQCLQSMILGYIVQSTIMRDVSAAGQARGIGAMTGTRFHGAGVAGLADTSAPHRRSAVRAVRRSATRKRPRSGS